MVGKYLAVIIFVSFAGVINSKLGIYTKINSYTSEFSGVVYQRSSNDAQHILLLGDS